MCLVETAAHLARWSGGASLFTTGLQRERARLYQRPQHARRFDLIRLALVFVLSLIWGAAFAETAPKVVPQNPGQVRLSFAPVVKKVTPAVVNVYASRIEKAARNPMFDDPIFRRFFGDGGDDFQGVEVAWIRSDRRPIGSHRHQLSRDRGHDPGEGRAFRQARI